MKRTYKIILAFSVIISQLLIGCATEEKPEEAGDTANKISYAELFAAEEEILTSFKILNDTTGVYRIPVERALMLYAAEATK